MSTTDAEAYEDECGYSFDHDEVIDYDGPDGIQWHCRRCGAEGWIDPDPAPSSPVADTRGATA